MKTLKRTGALIAAGSLAAVGLAACGGGASTGTESGSDTAAGGEVVLEFQQWWEPELPDGSLRGLMDQFESENPGIKVELLSGPYGSTRDQVVAGAASGTMADVVGLDGAWVYDFTKQGAIADLSTLMDEAGYDQSELASQVQVDGATYMIPVVNFVYPLYANMDILEKAGVSEVPSTREEFADAAKKISDLDDQTSGWILNLSIEQPSGIQNSFMSWAWASGGSMLTDGQPNLTGPDVTSVTEYVKSLWDAGVVAPGAFTMKEQDMVEEFINGRVGMMVDSLAHLNMIQEGNPDINLQIAAIPAEEDFSGERGIPYASWGVGIAENTKHPAEAWKLVEFLMSKDVNSALSTDANAFPGNTQSVPGNIDSNPLMAKAFEVYQAGKPVNEFVGLPVAEELMRQLSTQVQLALDGSQTVEESLSNAQKSWEEEF